MSNPAQSLFGSSTSTAPGPAGSDNPAQALFGSAPAGGSGPSSNPAQALFSPAGADTGAINASGPAAAPGPAYRPSGGILGGIANAVHTAGHIATSAVTGTGHVISGLPAVGGEALKELVAIPRQAGIDVYDDITSGSTYRNGQRTGGGLGPTQQEWTSALNSNPVIGGMIRGPQVTAEEVAHPSRIAKNYSANPVGAALNDIGTLATVLPPVGAAIRGMAVGGETSAAAIRAAEAADTISNVGKARLAAAKVGDAVTAVGHAPSLPFRATKGYLAGLADKLGTDPALLHAEDLSGAVGATAAPTVGAAEAASAAAAPVEGAGSAALTDARNAAIAANRGRSYIPTKSSLATIGASLNSPAVEMAKNTLVSDMSRLRDVATAEAKGTLAKAEADTQRAGILQGTTQKLQNSSIVTRLSDTDLANLAADAKAAGKPLDKYIRDMGFQKLDAATHGLTQDSTAYVTRDVASHLSRYTAPAADPTVVGSLAKASTRLTMVSKLALSPTTLINRVGHGVLATAANPNTLETLKTIPRALFGKLSEAEKADLATTTMPFHGAVDEAAAKIQATDPRRLAKLADAPSNLLARSPFLQIARKVDDATRSAVWLAARKAGATQEEADLILGRSAGYFDRATKTSRIVSNVVPFYNWHKQVMFTLEHMAEMHPAAFAQFTKAASEMADYQQQQGIYGGNTRFGGHDVDLSSINPFSGVAASPTQLVSPVLKAAMPMALGVLPSGKPAKGPAGDVVGAGLHQLPATIHELSNVLPQLRFASDIQTGGAPRYSTGQLVAPSAKNPATPAGDLHVWSSLLGIPVANASQEKATAVSIAASKAAAAKRSAGTMKSYNRKLSASGR